ncbi:hypothetical protein ACFS3C_10535 [Azotobacter vinelandii]
MGEWQVVDQRPNAWKIFATHTHLPQPPAAWRGTLVTRREMKCFIGHRIAQLHLLVVVRASGAVKTGSATGAG